MNQKLFLGIIIALISLSTFVSALPVGPETISRPYETRWPTWVPITETAIAGNVSELNFDGTTITRTYQGYVGNVTGWITLGDLNNNTLYDWTLASPQGEIYAVRSSTVPTWGLTTCASQAEIQAEDTRLNVNETIDEDSVNRTFVVNGALDQLARFPTSDFTHPQFWTANQSIGASSCAVATLYNNTYQPSSDFKEVLLSDNVNTDPVTGFVIYTTIISHTINPFGDSTGFDGRIYDFEMLVGEDGHGIQDGETATTSTYWFYLELD
jgi:hypothetical protein